MSCEMVIGMGCRSFFDAGLAMGKIRDGRLYREDFDSFEQYRQIRWQYGRNYVDRLVAAAKLFTNLIPRLKVIKNQSTKLRSAPSSAWTPNPRKRPGTMPPPRPPGASLLSAWSKRPFRSFTPLLSHQPPNRRAAGRYANAAG